MKWYSVVLLAVLMTVLLHVKDTESKKMTLEEAKKSIKNLRKTCSKKYNTPKELLDGQHKGEFPKEESLMCYMKCVLTATKSMKNDQINWEFFGKSARVMLVEEIVPRADHVVEVCQPQVTSTDGCEQAWQFSKCIYETDSEVISRYGKLSRYMATFVHPGNSTKPNIKSKQNTSCSRNNYGRMYMIP